MYEDMLKWLADAVETLNAFEKRHDTDNNDTLPYLGEIPVKMDGGEVIGRLVDEIGGSWSFVPTPSEEYQHGRE